MSETLTVSVGSAEEQTLTLEVDDPTREDWTSKVVGDVGPAPEFLPGHAVLTVIEGPRDGLTATATIEGQFGSDLVVRGLTPFA